MTDLEPPDFPSLSSWNQVVWGARYAVRGARIVVSNPPVWGYVLAPAVLMATAFVLGAGLVVWLVGLVTGWLWAPGPDAATWVVVTYTMALWALRLGLVAGLGLCLYLVAGLVATPFNDRLSDFVERRLLRTTSGDVPLERFLKDLVWSISHSALSLGIYLLVMVVLLLLNLIPGVGSVVGFVVGALVSSAFFTREAMDGALSRRRLGYLDKWRVVTDNWALSLGFGLVVSGAMWLPLLNFLILPMSVAGGTALFCHLERAGRIRIRGEVSRVGQDDPAHG